MPDGALRPCRRPRCPRLMRSGEQCPEHGWQHWSWRDPTLTTTQRGYGYDWVQVRNQVLARDGYRCQTCARQGVVRAATQVDHVHPLSHGGARLDPNNLEATCTAHHLAKSARERRRG